MLAWIALTVGLFYGTFWSKSEANRRTFTIVLTAWTLFSLALHMLGGPNLDK